MPVQWCSHPTSHQDGTRIGQKLSHPKADRRVDSDLATFINKSQLSTASSVVYMKEGNFSCRTCYEKEQIKFEAYRILQKPIEEREYETMDIDNDIQGQERRTISSLEKGLNSYFTSTENTPSSYSESSRDSEDDDSEIIYKQTEAKKLLNQVFSVLGISPVSDL